MGTVAPTVCSGRLSRRSLLKAAGAAGLLASVPALSSCSAPADTTMVRSDVARAAPRTGLTTALTPFATGLFDRVAPAAGNCVVSPLSVAAVLAMMRNGAIGATATELDAVLGASVTGLNDELNATLQALAAINAGPTGVKVNVANALWGQSNLTWQRPFLDALAANYGAGMRTVDFSGRSAQVVDQVNAWINTETSGSIPHLVTPDMITPMTRLVLANALHLKGDWASKFDAQATRKEPFTTASGGTVEADMMHQSLTTDWYATAAWRAAALRLADPTLAMVLILPTAPTAARLGDLLGGDGLARVFTGTATVQLSMPR